MCIEIVPSLAFICSRCARGEGVCVCSKYASTNKFERLVDLFYRGLTFLYWVNRFPDLSQHSGDLDSGCSSDPDPTPLKSPYDPVFNLDSNSDTEIDLHLHLNTKACVHPDPVLITIFECPPLRSYVSNNRPADRILSAERFDPARETF
ncbi:hypothetical protein EVAR_32383_1 [Eumeta japonica]|uniref:Uncharacterized protein n=1 Tax=Eumeta variegata TaxID=151549 RepID=A0A4C1VKQ0_EUMVA|nr:hypothetical protein EVAR_32383_1 [Eumeta japonica]